MIDDINDIKAYSDKYSTTTSKIEAQNAVKEFVEHHNIWHKEVGLIYGSRLDGDKIYGDALTVFSAKLCETESLNMDDVLQLSGWIDEYVKKTKYMMGDKSAVFHNLALCWCSLGLESYREKVLDAFKMEIFFMLSSYYNITYNLDCYGFKPCSQYTYHNLINERLTVTSPARFNDPFDCPLIELLALKGDKIEQLSKEAYLSCIKVACFSKNDRLPTTQNPDREKKHDGDDDEFLNPLMWAHYADSHRGICIKYHFNNNISHLYEKGSYRLNFFHDVEYSDSIYKYGTENSIDIVSSFFLKSKVWEYENEVRMYFFDINSNVDYDFVEIPNSISAIFFGLNCSKQDKESIMKILKGRKWENVFEKIIDGKKETIRQKNDISFFQMQMDDIIFGKLKAIPIKMY